MPFATTQMDLEIIILSEVRKKKINTRWYHLYVESKTWHKRTAEQKQTHTHREQTRGCQGSREGEGGTRSVGLVDVNYYI